MRNFATPEATTPGGAVSTPCRRSVIVRRLVRDGARTVEPGGAVALVDGAVGGDRDVGAEPRVARAVVLGGRGGHGQALAGVDVGPRAGRLHHVGRIALLVDVVVGGGGDEHHAVLVGVV